MSDEHDANGHGWQFPAQSYDANAPAAHPAHDLTTGPASGPSPEARARYLAAVVAAIAAAVVAGVMWGFVVKWTGREFGFLAWAVGVLVGLVAVRASGRKTSAVQAIAVAAAALGVLVGKYLAYAFVLHDSAALQFEGPPAVLSSAMFTLFRNDLHSVFSLLDLLWLGAAVASAALIARPVWPSTDPEPAPAPIPVTAQQFDEFGLPVPVVPERRPPVHQSRNPIDRLARRLPQPWRTIVDWTVTIAGAVAIVLLIKAYVVNPYRIPSSSMEPTLHCARPAQDCEARFSDRVLANRFIYHFRDPRRGEIVVFNTPPLAKIKCGAGGTFVKRIIGLPGEKVEVRVTGGDGYVYINGRKLIEPYIQQSRRAPASPYGPTTVPKDNYFMMGDNRAQSCDSRFWGTVPRRNIIGKVFLTYWPPNRLSFH